MQSLSKLLTRAIEITSVGIMVIMSLMVFINVVLRYALNSSIVSSEELSRFLFVWLTFLSAILAYQEKSHICVDFIVKKLGRWAIRWFGVISNILIAFCCMMIVNGSCQLTQIGLVEASPVTEIPMATLYISGIIGGTGIFIISVIRVFFGLVGKEV